MNIINKEKVELLERIFSAAHLNIGDNIQKNTQILVDIVYCVRRMNMIIYKYKERCSIIKNEELERSRFFKDHL